MRSAALLCLRGRRVVPARSHGWALVVGTVLLFARPIAASAHAELVSSAPAPGAQLGLAPAAVTLDFSEALNPGLSFATVTDGAGSSVSAHAVSQREMRVTLSTNVPGRYLVRWTAVSLDDGHTTRGAFTFTVAVSGGGGSQGGSASGPSGTDVAIAVGRVVEDTALLLAVGMLSIVWLARRHELAWVRPRLAPVVVMALVAGCAVVASETAIAAGGSLGGALSYLGSGVPGGARIARDVAEAAAVAAVVAGLPIWWGTTSILIAVVALSASGHAVGNTPGAAGVALDAAHLLTAGVWAGGILGLATLRPPGGWRAAGMPLLRAFSPWALGAFGTTVSLGIIQAALDVGGISPLIGTAYGRTLLVKAAAVVLMLPFSLAAWRLRRPHLRVEAGLAVAVVAAAAVLASSPVPARSSTGAASSPTAAPVLPRGDVVTLADRAGSVLVGLTLDPGRPGRNRLTIDAIPLETSAAAPRRPIRAGVDGVPVQLADCGDTCRVGQVTVHGGETVGVTVAGARGGTAAFVLPSLPAPDGTTALHRARARMGALHTFAWHETLTSGAAVVVTDYRAVAPDRLQYTQPTGFASVIIGTARYSRQRPGAAWTVETGGPALQEPDFVWDAFSPVVGVHVTGHPVIDGTATTEVAFFAGNAATPVWFRLDIDDHDLVRRARMTAPGHFMEQVFADFDAPMSVTAPSAVSP